MTIALDRECETDRKRRILERVARHFTTIGDQLLVALSNFILTLSISRSFGPEEVASYGISLAVGLIIQGVHRHAITIPLMLQSSKRVSRRCGGIIAQHVIIIACVIILGMTSTALSKTMHIRHEFMLIIEASVVFLVAYIELEFARAILIKLNRPIMVLCSAVFYSSVCTLLSVSMQKRWVDYPSLLALLFGAMLFHVLILATLIRQFDPAKGVLLLLADLRRYGAWAVVATVTFSGYNHLPLLILGVLAAPTHVAAFVATRSLMQPLQVLLRGLDSADKAIFSDAARSPHSRAAFEFTLKLAIPYICAAGLFGASVSVYSDELIMLAYGPKFIEANASLLAWVPVFLVMSASFPFESLIYSRNEFRRYYIIRGFASVIAVTLAVPFALHWNSVGAIAACGIGSLFAMSGTIILLQSGNKE